MSHIIPCGAANMALTPSGVLQMVRRRCTVFGVPYKGIHAFRRSAAAQMKRIGMNDSDIMDDYGMDRGDDAKTLYSQCFL